MAAGNMSRRKTLPTARAATCPASRVREASVWVDGVKYLKIKAREGARWMIQVSSMMKRTADGVDGGEYPVVSTCVIEMTKILVCDSCNLRR